MGSRHGRFVLLAAACLIAVQALLGLAVYLALPGWTERGQFGDMFGIVNTLFSGLAFAGVIYAILLQREDLALQREELKLTREELRRTAEAQEKSERALTSQATASNQSARLAAINYLLAHYEAELKRLPQMTFALEDPRFRQKMSLERKRKELLQLLDKVFDEIAPGN